MKTNSEYTEILNDLIQHLSDLKTRRRSAGRRWHVEGFTADAAELTQTLQNEVLAKVSREIVLDADEGIDYPALGDSLQNMLPIELTKPTVEEQAAVAELNKAVEALSAVLLQIGDELDRRHADEEYVKLYEDEVRKYMRYYGNSTLRDYKAFSEGDCLGSPTMEELENYRGEKLMHLFETGIFSESVAHKRSAKRYPDEVILPVPDKDCQIAEKDVYKHYFCLRKVCDFVDGCLVVNPSKAGHYFYAHRNDRKAKEQRTNFLKYMMKIRLAQEEMKALRDRRGVRLAALPESRKDILNSLAELVGYGEWVAPASDEKILYMLHNALGVGMYELTGEDAEMSKTLWSMLEATGKLRVVWQNLIGYFAEKRFFSPSLGSPALNEMFFGNRELYQNIDKGRPSYGRKSKKWAQVLPLLDRFVPKKE